MAPAVARMMVPTPRPTRPCNTARTTAPTSDRGTPLSDSETPWSQAPRMTEPTRYDDDTATIPTTRLTAATVTILARCTRSRRGTAAKVTRMVLWRYSDPITNTPNTP